MQRVQDQAIPDGMVQANADGDGVRKGKGRGVTEEGGVHS